MRLLVQHSDRSEVLVVAMVVVGMIMLVVVVKVEMLVMLVVQQGRWP